MDAAIPEKGVIKRAGVIVTKKVIQVPLVCQWPPHDTDHTALSIRGVDRVYPRDTNDGNPINTQFNAARRIVEKHDHLNVIICPGGNHG
jgi:hypothetical protein